MRWTFFYHKFAGKFQRALVHALHHWEPCFKKHFVVLLTTADVTFVRRISTLSARSLDSRDGFVNLAEFVPHTH